ncbi:MAG: ferritin [Clostridia bacterium]|nr:ferritin [Clostridia bacterium]
MLTAKVTDLLMDQINKELYSAYLYLDFANYYEDKGFEGFAHWYECQCEEEVGHAKKIREYLIDNSVSVKLEAIAKPDKKFASLAEPVKAGLEHEKYVSSLINTIDEAALEARDFRTMEFLNWFVKEQLEEEKSASDLLTKVELLGDDAHALLVLDGELAARK